MKLRNSIFPGVDDNHAKLPRQKGVCETFGGLFIFVSFRIELDDCLSNVEARTVMQCGYLKKYPSDLDI